jgi:hypothetical protein
MKKFAIPILAAYMLQNTVNPLVFKVGDKVTVTTQIENNKNMVNKVVKVG